MGKNRKILAVVFFCGMVLFLAGCVTSQEYVYKDGTFRKEEKRVEENQISEQKQKEERKTGWIGSCLGKNDFTKQCPVCKRRYDGFLEKCPYDGAKLEGITR